MYVYAIAGNVHALKTLIRLKDYMQYPWLHIQDKNTIDITNINFIDI